MMHNIARNEFKNICNVGYMNMWLTTSRKVLNNSQKKLSFYKDSYAKTNLMNSEILGDILNQMNFDEHG